MEAERDGRAAAAAGLVSRLHRAAEFPGRAAECRGRRTGL